MVDHPLGVLARRWSSFFRKPGPNDEEVARGCMGLPQELIDHIMDMLHDDLRTLKACSLTCKAMFVSARRLIHQIAYLDLPIVEGAPTRERRGERPSERQGRRPMSNPGAGLRLMAYMDDRSGPLKYARQVHIRALDSTFTPDSLLPYLRRFQSLDRIHTLTVRDYDAITWTTHFRSYFLHFYPTLITLTLHGALGPYERLLQFALQFPNLENLSFEWLSAAPSNRTVPVVIKHSPPLRGHLRLAGNFAATQWPVELTRKLPNGPNFRSMEFDNPYGIISQSVLNMCANTLECLTIRYRALDEDTQLRNYDFTSLEVLRRFTFHQAFPQQLNSPRPLLEALSTIRSPTFRELEFELTVATPSSYLAPPWGESSYWRETDAFLEEKFAKWGEFRLIIRLSGFPNRKVLRKHTEEAFPSLARRGCIQCEVFHSSQ